MLRTLRANENLHIVLWLFKDLCWVIDLRIAGIIMIIPTITMALYIASQCRKDMVN